MSKHAKDHSRMFRTMVLMGSSLALSCGGVAQEDATKTTNGGSSAGGKTATGTAGASSGGTGGTTSASAGAATSVGGTLTLGTGGSEIVIPTGGQGGTAGAGGAIVVPTDCPPSQWACTDDNGCDYESGWVPANCKCDPSRPKSAASCAAGQVYICRETSYGSDKPYGFECTCVTPTNTYCSCYDAYPSPGQYSCDTQSMPDTTLCGCAVVVLK